MCAYSLASLFDFLGGFPNALIFKNAFMGTKEANKYVPGPHLPIANAIGNKRLLFDDQE
jgi:hypothetical protein